MTEILFLSLIPAIRGSKKLTQNLDFVDHITNEGLEGRSVTGICMGSSNDSLMLINWRTKTVTEISFDGHTIGSFTHEDFKEPIDVAIDQDGQVYVADNGVGSVLFLSLLENC